MNSLLDQYLAQVNQQFGASFDFKKRTRRYNFEEVFNQEDQAEPKQKFDTHIASQINHVTPQKIVNRNNIEFVNIINEKPGPPLTTVCQESTRQIMFTAKSVPLSEGITF